ncbi:MAG: trypsin-like peptidase domain-containing protein [Pirellulales bacterium]
MRSASWIALTAGLVLNAGLVAPQARSQDKQGVVPASASAPSTKSASKPILDRESVDGQTYVTLDNSLSRVFEGWEPNSLAELKAHEAQQAKVADLIQRVTVNVQQGPAQGSGVLIRGGYVLTAAHVGGKPGRSAMVVLSDGRRLKAKTLGMNRNVDAGMMKLEDPIPADLPYATMGTSASLKTGQWVIGAGHPGGWQQSRGTVIRVGRILNVLNDTLVTDCALIGGDSGGPLFNLRGELIGIHSRIGTDVDDNMHVPIDTFKKDSERLLAGDAWGVLPGYVPVIGVTGVKGETRAVVGEITRNGPAARAGVEKGDVVLKFDGQAIKTFDDLVQAVRATLPGDSVMIEIQRGENIMRLPVVVGVQE